MEKEYIFDNIPTPTLLINFNTNELKCNNFFVVEFGVNVNSVEELNGLFVNGGHFKERPTELKLENGIIKLPNGKLCHVEIKFNPTDKEEAIVIIQRSSNKLDKLIKHTDFRNLFGDAPLGIIVSNRSTEETLYVSPFLIYKSGYSFEEIANQDWQNYTYSEDIPKQTEVMMEAKKNKLTSFFFEKRIISKTGKIFWVSEYIRNYTVDSQEFQTIIIRDISTIKEMDAELQRAKYLVEDAEHLKSAFLDNMPHEIRTPLHAITGFTSLLSDSELTHEERLEYVNFIQDSSNDILHLMDNIIEISKLETSQIKMKREKCYINSIFDKLQNDIQQKQALTEKEHLNIKVLKGDTDPLFTVISDPERIYQIMTHLLNNALKFTDQGEIEFGYYPPIDNKIEFYVRDTGIGINQEDQELIFKKFGKSGYINTNKNRGSGLGLTLSKKLVELLNGAISVESSLGIGSTFRFTITVEKEQKISITKPSITGENNWSSKTILVAEDTDSNYFFIEAFLERTKVNLLWAQDGLEAIKMFKENNVDLILMDIMMPEMDGYDATKEIKALDPEVPIVAQTALALPDDEEKCYHAGCNYVLVKPINSEDLIATIKRFIT